MKYLVYTILAVVTIAAMITVQYLSSFLDPFFMVVVVPTVFVAGRYSTRLVSLKESIDA